MDDIEANGGQDVIYQVLDERFPEEAVHDRIGEVLDNVFDLKAEKGESTATFTGRVRAAFSAAEAEGIKIPSVARGYLLLRFSRLQHEKKAVVMAAARQSYEEKDVAAALRTTYPEGLFQAGRQSAAVHLAEHDDDLEEEVADLISQEVLVAEADPGAEDEPIEEQDAIDILMTWKQTRNNISKEKMARGFGGMQDLRRLEARVKCFKCKQVGHFSRNCPRKGKGKGADRSNPAAGGSTSKVNMVFMVAEDKANVVAEDDLVMSAENMVFMVAEDKVNVVAEDDIVMSAEDEMPENDIAVLIGEWDNQTRDSWSVEGNEVIRHHALPRTTLFSPARSHCPVPVDELSAARKTIMQKADLTEVEHFSPNWKTRLEAHKTMPFEWTGKTVFYKLACHGLPDDESMDKEIDDIAEVFLAEWNDQVWEEPDSDDDAEETTVALVHEAGFGVVDTGCGRGIVGENTLAKHQAKLEKHGWSIEDLPHHQHTFRYGNGAIDVSIRRVQVPIFIRGIQMKMRLHVVPGSVPLLVSKRFLKGLGARLDLDKNEVVFSKAHVTTSLVEQRDGSYQIDLMEMNHVSKMQSPEVDVLLHAEHGPDETYHPAQGELVMSHQEIMEELDEAAESDDGGVHCVFSTSDRKDLIRSSAEVLNSMPDQSPTIVEVFCPDRFSEHAEKFGMVGRASFDLSSGWDWRRADHRRSAEEIIDLVNPDLVLMCPPCGPLSPLQQCTPPDKRIDPIAHEHEVQEATQMVRWCCKIAKRQLEHGKHFIFEASKCCRSWTLPELQKLIEKVAREPVDVPACAVGLRDPDSQLLFGKKWSFLTSAGSVSATLSKFKCTGDHKHQVVEGSSGGMMRSIRTQVYPKRLIQAILGGFACQEQHESFCGAISQATIQQPLSLKGENLRKVKDAIRKMHVNLGHASVEDLTRILRHHGAQAEVLELVRAFSCDICDARRAPKAVKDSSVPKDLAPLRYVGLDVKWLPTWKKDHPIKALNIVCRASGLQQMFPFRETETTEVICRLYRRWTRAYGRPRYIKFDAAKTNLGQAFLDLLERDGTTPLDVPGEAHEQMGDVEVQGRHFSTMLQKVIDELNPEDYDQWLECVDTTVEAKNSLMRRGGYSPYQMVLGRDPEFPGDDLLTDNPNPISNGAILEDAMADFSNRARQCARAAVLEALDHRAARIALNSRPRPLREFRPGLASRKRHQENNGQMERPRHHSRGSRWKLLGKHAWSICQSCARATSFANSFWKRSRPVLGAGSSFRCCTTISWSWALK